jgi:hypothetical protein
MKDLLKTIRPGGDQDADLTVLAVIKDEMFFLPAFLAHYRALGAGRFVFVDDRSTDGGRDFLAAQPDCAILESDYGYGEQLDGLRAGQRWKEALAQGYAGGRWGLLVDADEFLALDAPALDALIARLDARGLSTALAALIDLYPADMATIRRGGDRLDPATEWWFDAGPCVAHPPGDGPPLALGDGVKGRLARRFDLMRPEGKRGRFDGLLRRLGRPRPVSFGFKTYKTPLLKISPDLRLQNSHWITPAAAPPDILPLAHYRFTPDLQRRIPSALASRAYAMNSQAYGVYDAILNRLEQEGGSFLFEGSRRFETPADFYAAGAAVEDVAARNGLEESLRTGA